MSDERFTCHDCGKDVPRDQAFPVTEDGEAVRVCPDCREARGRLADDPHACPENILRARAEADRSRREAIAKSRCRECGGAPGEDPYILAAKPDGTFDLACRPCAMRRIRERQDEVARKAVERNIGRRYADCTRENLKCDPATRDRIWASADGKRSCLIFGPNGTGKTHASAVMYREAVAEGRAAVYRTATELVDDLRAAVEKHTVREAVDAIRKADLFVIDDLAMERPTEWVLEQLCRLVDWRYRDDSQTVVTTNLGPRQIREAYGDRITSRIVGLAGKNVFKLDGRDHREDELRGSA